MSKNINQVFIANPITSNAGTDLMYFGQSPYGVGNDAAMTFTNFSAQFALASAIINPAHGGTGINNGTSTITIGANFAMSGAFAFTGTLTGVTGVTFPTSGTLATTAQIPTLPISLTDGGTNASLVANVGGIVWSNATQFQILSGTATAQQMLQSGASTTPSWSTATWPATTTANQLLYSSSINTVSEVTGVIRASLSTNATGVPTWLALTDGQLVIGSTAGAPAAASLTAGAGISITPGSNSISIAASSGSGSPLTNKGDLYTFSTVNTRLAVGTTDGQILQVSSGAATGLAWSTPTYPSASGAVGKILRSDATNNVYTTSTFADTYAASTILYSNGANTVTGLATANSSVLVTTSAGVPVQSGTLTNGQMIIGSTGATPAVGTISASGNMSVTVGAGTLALATTGFASFAWNDVAGTTQAAAVNNGYIISNAGQTTVTLPATAAEGSVVSVQGKGAAGYVVAANTGQVIHFGNSATSSGGTLTSTNQWDAISVVCVTANTTWAVSYSVGSLSVA